MTRGSSDSGGETHNRGMSCVEAYFADGAHAASRCEQSARRRLAQHLNLLRNLTGVAIAQEEAVLDVPLAHVRRPLELRPERRGRHARTRSHDRA